MENDRDTTDHSISLEDLEVRLADVRRERGDLLTFHLAKTTTVDPEAREDALLRAIILSLELKQKETDLMRQILDLKMLEGVQSSTGK
jgi:hypothetical protein